MVSIGFIAWIILSIIFGLIAIGVIIYACVRDTEYEDIGRGAGIVLAFGWLLATVIVTLIGFFPFNMEYHSYRPISGTVSTINSRLISAGDQGGSNQKFVVTFKGSDKQYGCEDTRCATVRAGDTLSMKCIRDWQYASNSGYDCRFVSWEPSNAKS